MTYLWTRYESDFRMAVRLQADYKTTKHCAVTWIDSGLTNLP